MTGRWKRSRPEDIESSALPAMDSLDGEDQFLQTSKRRATSVTTTSASTNLNHEILHEFALRLDTFQYSARALVSCLQNRDVSRKTVQSMIEAAKCMFPKLLGEASDDLEHVTLQ